MAKAVAGREQGRPLASKSLGDLRLNTDITTDSGTSSGDDDILNAADDQHADARGTIGISISRLQTRIASPQTPAVEKVAAINEAGDFFANVENSYATRALPEDDQEDVDHEPSPDTARPTPVVRLSASEEAQHPKGARSVLKNPFGFGRRRATSDVNNKDESRGKSSLWTGLPSLGKRSPFSRSREVVSKDEPTSDSKSDTTEESKTEHAEEAKATVSGLPTNHDLQKVRSRPSTLRRSTSDNSLLIQRTLSRVSSLGDDSRFSDVHEQVNSRFKAVKDSFQDSSLRFPSISSLTPDFLRDRSNSASAKSIDDMKGSKRPIDPMTRQPYHSAKVALHDAQIDRLSAPHSHLTKAMDVLEGDLVILGGYRGSILRSAEPPHRQLWVPIKVGLNLRKVDLEVGLGEKDDERSTETIIPGGMLTHIGPVDISRRLFKRLRSCENAKSGKLRVHDYGYDWRLHPLHLSRKLIAFLESLPCNQPAVPKANRGATVIAHSLGGLITRHAVNQRPDLFRGVVYAGVPKTCVNILGPLRNGDDVLLSSRVLTAQVNFTIRTSFALLPLDGRCFVDKHTKEEYRVDFFDPQTWLHYRLSPCVARPLPPQAPPPSKPSGLAGHLTSLTQALPSLPLPGRRATLTKPPKSPSFPHTVNGVAEPDIAEDSHRQHGAEATLAHGNIDSASDSAAAETPPSVRTAVTIPRDDAMAYLTRTLASVKRFKEALAFNPAHAEANVYPPIAVIYGKTTPTVFGARVDGREGIKRADAYDDLAFASGDGVVLARAAMVPNGYRTVRGGVVSSERGHVTLLGDLEAVGRCLNAVIRGRKEGVGVGRG